jgi:hypothetical protein
MKGIICLILAAVCLAGTAAAQETNATNTEHEAIREAALNYIEGWYEGNVDRMDKALHPDLAKRQVVTMRNGRNFINTLSKSMMLEYTQAGGGTRTPKEKVKHTVTILDAESTMASVKVVSTDFIDYLHVAKSNGEWKIINVLWEPSKDRVEKKK